MEQELNDVYVLKPLNQQLIVLSVNVILVNIAHTNISIFLLASCLWNIWQPLYSINFLINVHVR